MAYAKAHRHPEAADRTIWEIFEAELPRLVRYAGRFDGFHGVPASVSKTFTVRFDDNKYSVLVTAVGSTDAVDAPTRRHRAGHIGFAGTNKMEASMSEISIVAIDLAKNSFQVYDVKTDGVAVFNKSVSRSRLIQLLSHQKPSIMPMEACATSHHWGRIAQVHGHEVRTIPAIYVKPFVKRQKNDFADVAAIAEAASRPSVSFVAVKCAEKQARAVAFRTHQCFMRQRTQLINALRGHLAELGLVVPKGSVQVKLLEAALSGPQVDLPKTVREMGRLYLQQIGQLTEGTTRLANELEATTKTDDELRRLCAVPGVGPVTGGAIAAFAPDLETFDSGRNFAA